MSIIYPLDIPSGIVPSNVLWRMRSAASMTESAFTGQQQVQVHQKQLWTVELDFPPMARDQAEALIAFLAQLNGLQGKFRLPSYGALTPRGVATGTPQVKGSGQSGQTLVTRGWTPSTTGILKAGDFIEVRKNLIPFPDAIDNAAWTKFDGTITSTSQTDPEGGTTADRVTPNVSASNVSVFDDATIPTGITVGGRRFDIGFWALAATPSATIEWSLRNQANTIRFSDTGAVLGSWGWFSVGGTMNSADTGARLVMGGSNSWPESDGAIDLWGVVLDTPQTSRLYKVMNDVDSDANGKATLDIWPRLREDPGDFARIITANPAGLFRLAGNESAWTVNNAMHFGLSLTAIEAVP